MIDKNQDEIAEKLYQASLRFLSFRPRSEKEIKDYLQQKSHRFKLKQPQKFIPAIIKKLKKLNLINDKEFARWWIDQRIQLNPKGRFALTQELKQKGLKATVINLALRRQFSSQKEKQLAQKLLNKKLLDSSLPSDKRKRKQRLAAYLSRRGFSFSLIRSLIDEKASGE